MAPFPGITAYAGSKAALRIVGMGLGAERTSPSVHAHANVAIISYEPGVVDSEMQRLARSQPPETLPCVEVFRRLATEGRLVAPSAPAAEIVQLLEGEDLRGFNERRFGGL